MSYMERLLTLSYLLKEFGPVKGERAIQKLIYLIQSHTYSIGYIFHWRKYGPVSETLDDDLLEAEMLGYIKIIWDNNIPVYICPDNPGITSYWQEKSRRYKLPSAIQRTTRMLKTIFGESEISNPWKIQLIASFDYLKKNDRDNLELFQENIPSEELIYVESVLKKLAI